MRFKYFMLKWLFLKIKSKSNKYSINQNPQKYSFPISIKITPQPLPLKHITLASSKVFNSRNKSPRWDFVVQTLLPRLTLKSRVIFSLSLYKMSVCPLCASSTMYIVAHSEISHVPFGENYLQRKWWTMHFSTLWDILRL